MTKKADNVALIRKALTEAFKLGKHTDWLGTGTDRAQADHDELAYMAAILAGEQALNELHGYGLPPH